MRTAVGGLVDRNRLLSFTFDGRALTGHPGDTLASALLANGIRLVGRSFKYHRPRGILSAGPEEPNALVELRTDARREPNTRATVAELYEGLGAQSQNRWPSLALDARALGALAAPILGAGFYYKTFMWPAAFWERVYEPLIRRAAGLGRAADAPDPDTYETVHAHCDVLVIGAGPSGLSAALAAGRAGARVILADEDFLLGGRLLAERAEIDGRPAAEWLAATLAELAGLPEVRVLPRTTVYGVYDHGSYGAVERVGDHLLEPSPHIPRQRAWRIVARRAVLASGAIERPHVFGGNDRPGAMLAGAVRAYLNRYGVLPGRRLALFATSDDGWRTAFDFAAAGGAVAAVIDARREIAPALRAQARRIGAEVLSGAQVVGTRGHLALAGIDVIDAAGRPRRFACDTLAMANGWNPAIHLASHLGRRPVWDGGIHAFVPDGPSGGMAAAGAAAGRLSLAEALRDGAGAGAQAAEDCGFAARPAPDSPGSAGAFRSRTPLARCEIRGQGLRRFPERRDGRRRRTRPSRGLPRGRAPQALHHAEHGDRPGQDGARRARHHGRADGAADRARRHHDVPPALHARQPRRARRRPPRTGFPADAADADPFLGERAGRRLRRGRPLAARGLLPEGRRGGLAGERRPRGQDRARRRRDLRREHARQGRRAGHGRRPLPRPGLRQSDGQAPHRPRPLRRDAARGRLRHGRRHGRPARRAAFRPHDHHRECRGRDAAPRVLRPVAVARPRRPARLGERAIRAARGGRPVRPRNPARDRRPGLRPLGRSLPFMAAAAITVGGGIPARLFRLSFSGERAYELAVPAAYGEAAMRALMRSGEPHGIVPYGTEALGVMRIEKGHVAGAELDGRTTARDLGLGRMASTTKDYVGRLMKERPGLVDPDRPTLAGFRPVDRSERLRAGAHFLALGADPSPAADEGHMSSVAHSPSLGHWIGLGLIRRGPERHGERVRAYDPVRGGDVVVEICPPCHLDPQGDRLRG